MKFSLLKIDDTSKLKKLSKNKRSFFYKEEDVTLFHYNVLENGLYHAVFNVNDEYQVGTKKLGKQYNLSYSSLVNFFFLEKNKYAFIEHTNDQFRNEVISYIENRTKSNIKLFELDNKIIMKIFNTFDGTVKKIEYTNEYEELLDKDFVNTKELNDIANSYEIDRITFLVENQYLSLTKSGNVIVDNSDENFLINFTKRILSTIG